MCPRARVAISIRGTGRPVIIHPPRVDYRGTPPLVVVFTCESDNAWPLSCEEVAKCCVRKIVGCGE
ncbi:hypothetical protein HanRHA438_Chr06g0255891 [Helianthus annuus]|nr:hypothetical protein HanRHA438_Chr06g0255891 [Helianthus annuus]